MKARPEMPRPLNEVIGDLPAKERAEIEVRARELIAEELSIRDLRKSVGKTQRQLANRLKVGQEAISKIEARADIRVSTLRNVVQALGGELELIVRLPGRRTVRLREKSRAAPRAPRRSRPG